MTPAAPGLFFLFAATVLLIFVSISSPTWNKIAFLDTAAGDHYGVFGYTGSRTHIGYYFPQNASSLNTRVLHNLTKTLILFPIAAGLSGIAFLAALLGIKSRIGMILATLTASLATLACGVAWVISMALFGIVRNRYRDQGIGANYGNAEWIALGALVALLLGFCTSAFGIFGSYRRRRETTTTANY